MKRYFHAMIFALALLIAPFASADLPGVDVGYTSTDHQVMSDAKTCMACHVAPESERQHTSEYKVKASALFANHTNSRSPNASAFKMRNPYTEVGW